MGDFRSDDIKFLDCRSASNFLSLVRDLKTKECSLAIGAGVSFSAGLPSWINLLERIACTYFYHWLFDISHNKKNVDFDNPPINTSIAFLHAYDIHILEEKGITFDITKMFSSNTKVYINGHKQKSNYIEKMISKEIQFEELNKKIMSKVLENMKEYDLLLIAQMIKNQVKKKDWNYLLRKSLYNQFEQDVIIGTSDLMDEIGKMIEIAKIKNVLNFNYDDLLYHTLKRQNQKFRNVYDGCQMVRNQHKIFYPHGYLPVLGGVITEIVLSEEDYHKIGFQFDSWSNMIQSMIYNSTICIFVGLSMTDPNLRRILKACKNSTDHVHYAFLPSKSSDPSKKMIESLFDADLNRLGIKVIRFPLSDATNSYSNLSNSIKLISEYLKFGTE